MSREPMSEEITRRGVLRTIGAGAAATGVVGQASATPGKGDGNGNGPDRMIVGLKPGADFAVARQKASSVHREMDFERHGKAVAGSFPEPALNGLRNHPQVDYVEEDGTAYALAQSTPWGIDRVDADVLHSNGETGSGADLAILDTGIDEDHPDLAGNLGAGKAYATCDGSNGSTCNNPWDDDNEHGTHCAGTADAIDNTEGVVGVSTEATLHAVKVLASDGSGSYSDIAAGIEYVADQGWDVASMSLGGSSGNSTLKNACQYAADKGVLLVAAAGNSGPCSDCVGYPAAYSTVMAVSSTASDDSLSSFSSTGPEVDIAAPGSNVNSTLPADSYGELSGTSMACPHVSGAGAQLMANGFTASEARSRLENSAEDIGLGSNESGAGLLDAEKAVLGAGFSVTTESATNVDGSSATLNGTLDNLDGASSADVSFEWRQTGASSWNTTSTQTLSATGSFSASLSGLNTGTEYEYRAVGSASDGDSDTGGTVTFVASNCADASQWPSGSGVSGYEYISQVDADGQVVESSSDNAYYDFTCPDVVAVEQGGSFTIALDYNDGGYDGHYGNVYVDWGGEGDWSTATETQIMADVNDDTTTYTATVDVPSDAATGATLARVRLSYGQFYGPSATDEYGEVNDVTVFVEGGGESAPTVDDVFASEVETANGDAEFSTSWQVSDADGNLDAVDLTLTDDTAGATDDSRSYDVSGDTASADARLVAAGDDGSGHSYTVSVTATDTKGNSASDSVTVTEAESAPTVDGLSLTEVETGDGDAEFDASWDVSDADGDLGSVELTLSDDTDGGTEDSATVDVSGSSDSGTTRLVAAGDEGSGNSYTVDLTVSDSDGTTSTDSATAAESEQTCVDASNWPSGSGASGYEYITQVDVDGQVVKSSSDSAYYDFTCPDVVTVQQGGSFTIALDYDDAGYDDHNANVYVDWDGDGSWSSTDETVIVENANDDTVTYTATVDVPSDAATGATLARVRLSWNSLYGPTATGEYGEVDDFTIVVE